MRGKKMLHRERENGVEIRREKEVVGERGRETNGERGRETDDGCVVVAFVLRR
ncbi:hypothetical protein A2U01_0086538, partial [Trifolium medium]|nr:hypothetical protein [Trifolium medium]